MMSEFSAASLLLALIWNSRFWFVPTAASLLVLSFVFASECHTWELDAASFWFESSAAALPPPATRLKLWLDAQSITGRFHALELDAVKKLATVCETRFGVGLDFVTTLSSLVPSCVLFDIVWGQLAELKLPMLNKWRRWFHPSRVKLPCVSMSVSWFLKSMYLIWIFGSRLILSKNPSSATLWVRDTCLIYGLPSFDDFLDHRFSIFKKCKAKHQSENTSRLKKHNRHWITQDRCAEFESWFGCWCVFLMICYAASLPTLSLWISLLGWR